jgi:hypothetical protein
MRFLSSSSDDDDMATDTGSESQSDEECEASSSSEEELSWEDTAAEMKTALKSVHAEITSDLFRKKDFVVARAMREARDRENIEREGLDPFHGGRRGPTSPSPGGR